MILEQERAGVIERVFYCSPETGFFTGKVKGETGRAFSVKGTLVAAVGDRVELVGSWVTHSKYGRQFHFTSGRIVIDESRAGLVALLATNKRFEGFGPAKSERLIAAAERIAGDGKLTDVLMDRPEDLADAAGLPVAMVLLAAEVWGEQRAHFEDAAALLDMGWSNVQASAIIDHYGAGAPSRIGRDPYALVGQVKRFGFLTVDAVALKMGIKKSDPGRIAAGVVFCLTRDQGNGHTWMTYRALLMAAMRELQPDTLNGEDLIQDSIDNAVGEGVIFRAQTPEGEDVVAYRAMAAAEVRVFERLLWGLRRETDPLDLSALAGTPLNDGQRQAVEGFSRTIYSVISGSAGTGKTHLVKAIYDISRANGLEVRLCAPTGKAAVRLSQATDADATTIHQLLGPYYDPASGSYQFMHGAENKLDADVIVVDESSMVDPYLMRSLLSAMQDECRLVLVGDHNQIPSVQAGAILRDILRAVDSLPGSIHILTDVVRQRGVLARNTAEILKGLVSPQETHDWGFIRPLQNNEALIPDLAAGLVDYLSTNHSPELDRIPDLVWDIQLLCPMKAGIMGMHAINAKIQNLHQGRLGQPAPPPVEEGKAPKPCIGDKVIWMRNNYKLQMMNGQMGVVTALKKGGASELRLEDGRTVEVPAEDRFSYELGYAITIHKSQGSQWPYVILLISETQYMMRDVNLLYTGASRASVSLTFAGTGKGINSFSRDRKSHTRRTFGSLMAGGWIPIL